MASFTQTGRPIRITTPLGTDVLLLERLTVDEAVSKPFEIELELLSENASIASKDILQKKVTIEVDLPDGSIRYFNGLVRRFVQLGRTQGLVTYRAEVVPSVWFLSLSSDCRIFQNMTAVDIVKKVFDDAGMKDYKVVATGSFSTRDYCVQYRESHLAFVSRLLEEEGIYYYFEHTSSTNTIVMANATSSTKAAATAKLSLKTSSTGALAPDSVFELEIGSSVSTGKVTLNDYNFETPSTSLKSMISAGATSFPATQSEFFDYPGEFKAKADGDQLARVRMDELEAMSQTIRGRSNARGLGSGQKVTLSDHYRGDVNQAYHLLSLHHEGTVGDYLSGGGESFVFDVSFTGIPASVIYRPPRVTPKSIVHGAQTAVVVGPAGEEIFVDKYGRVKVQFFWDRVGTKNENSSCWMRVSSTWAGKQWGFIQIPRIGQEVIVEFLEGDPDQPIITGRVYNLEQMPPYSLPANQTQSGLKTRSSTGGSPETFNELRFEDKKGSEEVSLHSEKDFNAMTENDETWKVLGKRTTEITKDETKTVKEGNDTTTISKGDHSLTISEGNQTIAVSKGNQTVTVDADHTFTVNKGKHSVTVTKGDMSIEVSSGNHSTQLSKGNVSLKAAAGAIANEAAQSIELKCGPSSIKLAPDGITIKGVQVKIEGTAMVEMKGPMTTVKGDGMLTLKGGITMIN